MRRHQKFLMEDQSHIGEARRAVQMWSADLSFNEVKSGQISIVINELSTNLLKHSKKGEIIATMDKNSITLLALDHGPGIKDIPEALLDGYSTHGTAGNGLGAIKRLSDSFDIYSQVGIGTLVCAQFFKEPPMGDLEFSGFSLPVKGEIVSGDDWTVLEEKGKFILLVSDGLGHGLHAHEASVAGVNYFEEMEHLNPLKDVEALHHALRSTRGAAISVAHVDSQKKVIDYCGLGNIVGHILNHGSSKRLISHNGTAGVQMRKIQSLPYPIEKSSVLVFHSDGISTHWDIGKYPGLLIKHPMIVAGIIYRDFSRGNDDVTVVAGRYRS